MWLYSVTLRSIPSGPKKMACKSLFRD